MPYSILEYSWNGAFRRSIKLPVNTHKQSPDGVFFVRDSLFIGHNSNYSGKEDYHFFLFDTSGNIVKTFDNHVKIARSQMSWNGNERSMKPIRASDGIYVKEIPNDTLFCLNEQDELIPKYVFNLGKYAYSKRKRANSNIIEGMKDVIFIPHFVSPLVVTPNFIFFNPNSANANIPSPKGRQSAIALPPGAVRLGYCDPANPRASILGIYDITKKTTRLLDTDPFLRTIGIINNLDGGMPFWPFYCNSNNELIDMYEAGKMKEYLTEEYFAAHEIKNLQAHQKLRELLKTLKEDDNPVIVVAKMK